MKTADMTKKLSEQGLRHFEMPQDKLNEFYERELELWGTMVKTSGAKLE